MKRPLLNKHSTLLISVTLLALFDVPLNGLGIEPHELDML